MISLQNEHCTLSSHNTFVQFILKLVVWEKTVNEYYRIEMFKITYLYIRQNLQN